MGLAGRSVAVIGGWEAVEVSGLRLNVRPSPLSHHFPRVPKRLRAKYGNAPIKSMLANVNRGMAMMRIIEKAANAHGIDPALLAAVALKESNTVNAGLGAGGNPSGIAGWQLANDLLNNQECAEAVGAVNGEAAKQRLRAVSFTQQSGDCRLRPRHCRGSPKPCGRCARRVIFRD
jgi:hypothetical protein